ncbi:D-serine ammonia-lyase [Peribacillus sp. NJ4]|uniref:D-serine ammonia-lyase n=1 Tax=unclassified Peribacillus TaxID=2675266 RepID=UPI0025A28F29|nr:MULTISPECIES: D-serine ammonia-lyase [unclassified Peribacillus]MDM5212382.1 D-serine ammonia-lyase [Peribacillus sp. NJ4]MDM5222713.1 D-serine ammonia-lyase [Peribacillus sp. NJ11]
MHKIAGLSIMEWKTKDPMLKNLINMDEVFWMNPNYGAKQENPIVHAEQVKTAEDRLDRFANYMINAFPETGPMEGIIESPLVEIPSMQKNLEESYKTEMAGKLLLKCDSHLPISGSIKARGGIYEVLKRAEEIAMKHGGLRLTDNYGILASDEYKELFSKYSIAVGSTGNLGMSIGIISAKLGFRVTVHMSADAKQWKKDKLTSLGVIVREYDDDYSKAVEEGRMEASLDPNCHFIDDENSVDLLLGYATAATRLKKQLKDMSIPVDEDHPLFVYLPCGVGGGPGGITYGLKLAFGDDVHCFFAEPTHSPCMTLGLMTGLHDKVSVQEFGIDNKTEADGLAVGRPSALVSSMMTTMLSGSYTIEDKRLFELLREMAETEGYYLEPSALAGAFGPIQLFSGPEGRKYLRDQKLLDKMNQSTHIIWATGGSMVPKDMMEQYLSKS